MLVTLKELLLKAQKGGYAVGAFNVNNLEIIQAVIEAAETEYSPLILSTSEGAIEYAGLEELATLIKISARKASVPICLHLDHGKNINLVEEVIKSGLYTSIMYDGSALEYEENLFNTKRLAKMAHRAGMSIEAELGALAGIEDFVEVEEKDAHLTNPEQARDFVYETGCDALAIAIGTSHGAFKYKGEAQLDFERLERIREFVNIPLVLHGASGVPEHIKTKCMQYGCEIADAKGVEDYLIKKAVNLGICKINIDTDIRIAFDAGVRKYLQENPEVIDPRKIMGGAKELMTEVAREKMRLFGSSGRI
jgi:fructose-bisphosphate aldolase class II